MSLINQMLRDLESRRQGGRQLPSGEGPAAMACQPASRRLLLLIISGLLVIALAWGSLEVVGRTLRLPKSSAKHILAPALVPPVTGKQELVAAEATAAVLPPAAKTADLLNLRVLETVSSSRLMLEFELLPEYSWRYTDEAQTQLTIRLPQTQLPTAAEVPPLQGPLLEQLTVEAVGQDLLVLVAVRQKIKLQTFELAADPFHGQRLLLEFYRQEPSTAAEPATATATAEPVEVPLIEEKAVAQASRVTKKTAVLTPSEQAQQRYRMALQQLQRGEYQAAETALQQALLLQPELLEARLKLILLQQERGQQDAAQMQLLQGLQLHPENPELRKSYARQLMEEGFLLEAVEVLESQPQPQVAGDPEYFALLAASLQQAENHPQAAAVYRQLLTYKPQESLWWLGLAISLEQTGERIGAKEAYQKAYDLPGLRADLQDYVDTRLKAL